MNARIKLFGKIVPAWMVVGGLIMAASGAGVGTVLAGSISGEMPITVSQALLIGEGAVIFPQSDHNWESSSASATCSGCDNSVTLVNNVYTTTVRDTFISHHDRPDRSIGVVSDDKTGFQAAAELDQGDKYLIQVCLSNMSRQQAITQLDLNVPAGIETEIFGGDEVANQTNYIGADNTTAADRARVHNVTRIGAYSWKFTVDGGARSTGTLTSETGAESYGSWRDCIGIQLKTDDTNPPGNYSVSGSIKQIAY